MYSIQDRSGKTIVLPRLHNVGKHFEETGSSMYILFFSKLNSRNLNHNNFLPTKLRTLTIKSPPVSRCTPELQIVLEEEADCHGRLT